jgi:hypothetical protein
MLEGGNDTVDIKAVRKTAGMSQIQLSRRANISRFRLYLAECNSLQLRPEEVRAIGDVVGPELEKAARIASDFQANTVIPNPPHERRSRAKARQIEK